ncbi:MAG: LysR family transcriptional regulator [Acidobacteria bacterium]|nr:LysR family transcriptional regulator [Acidobacteriota bacterium]
MDLRQLEIIRAIADTGSFTAAGEKLHVSQSAISRQVLLLEAELGEAVFHRVGRRIRITPAGESLLQLSHRVFQDLQDTIALISDTSETLRGTMRLVGSMTVCLYVFPSLLAQVRRTHPDLDLKVTVGSGERSLALLRSGAADLGLVTLPVEASDLESVPVLEEELLLITYPAHPLARKGEIRPSDLVRQPFILFEAGSITRRLVEAFFTRQRIEPEIVMETENVEIIKAMVRSGLGISIVPWQAAAADVRTGQLFCSRIAGHALHRQTGWLYPKMRRLPRAVSEVMRVFDTIRPQFEATVRAPRAAPFAPS